jgi:methionine synthase I (cobalamin-dependent)/5,10-methylenetetrahydrofolate reductase
MEKSPILKALENRILIFDGAMGTELYSRGFYINRPFEELNLSSAIDVKSVHKAYLDAGSEVITTNSFSIPKPQLKKFDIEIKQKDFVHAALKNASEARSEWLASNALKDIFIVFAIGPLGVLVEPLGPVSKQDVFNEYQSIGEHIAASPHKPDAVSLETFGNLNELEAAVAGLRSVLKSIPLIANITTKVGQSALVENFANLFGNKPEVDVLGLNCCEGPSQVFTDLQTLVKATNKPIITQPNAGIPRQINGRYFYMTSPDYLAKYARRYADAGANGVGGCCGTSPEHIEAIYTALKVSNAQMKVRIEIQTPVTKETSKVLSKLDWQSRPQSKIGKFLSSGKKILSVEVTPPKGTDTSKFLNDLEVLISKGVDFVNIPDGPRASTRISSLHLSVCVANRFKGAITPIPHFTTRDRNLIALQADLLGAFVNGVSEVLFVTGDPPKVGNNKDATGVYDIDSIGLTYLANCLNHGTTPAGDDLGSATRIGIGVASNPTAINVETELSRWNFKCQMGADFAFTQPIYDPEVYFRWMDKLGSNHRPHVVGIWPFVSLRNAEFMANEVPGVVVPKWAVDEMAKAGQDKIEAEKRGIDIANRVIQKITHQSAGFSVSAPLGRTHVALEVIKSIQR